MDIVKYKGQLSLSMRPHTLNELHGCDDFKKAVLTYQKNNSWPTAILLQGRFGSGKTTAALIMAQMMNCKKPNPDGSPCCECASCKSIMSNTYNNDVLFIDATMCKTAEDIDALNLDEFLKMPSMQGNHKVIIVDEFQQITGQKASKMFLKIAETTQSKVHIIFTSMENISYNKKYEAIVSRCQKFFFGNKSTLSDIMFFIKETLEKLDLWSNKVDNHFSDDSAMFEWVKSIADYAKGSYRQAIQNLQSCLERDLFTPENVKREFEGVQSNQHQALMDILNGKTNTPEINSIFFPEYDDDAKDNINEQATLAQNFSYAYLEVSEAYYYNQTKQLPPKYDISRYSDTDKDIMKKSFEKAKFYKEKEIPELAGHKNFNILLNNFKKISVLRQTYLGKADFMVAMCDLFSEIKSAEANTSTQVPIRGASSIPIRGQK